MAAVAAVAVATEAVVAADVAAADAAAVAAGADGQEERQLEMQMVGMPIGDERWMARRFCSGVSWRSTL